MNNLNLADLTCEPIIAKKAQDDGNIGVCQYSANQLLKSITPENMVTGIQRLFNIKNYEDNFLTSWQDDFNNWNKLSEVITAMLRDNSRYNGKFSYNKNGLATVGLVHYLSKYQQNREQDAEIDNNPLTDNGVHWSRGIKDNDVLPQRFNLWNVSINNRTITLTSTADFSDYLFTANQLKNGLEISFIPTQDGSGYSAGNSYIITIDGVSKKLFEDEDETKAINQPDSYIKNGVLLSVYYKTTGDDGNGAFYVRHPKKNDNNFAFVFGMHITSKSNVANPSWLLSDATAKDGTTYNSIYDKLVDVNTNGTAGTITINGTNYNTKEKDGFVVIDSADWLTIYNDIGIVSQFGIDTTNQQFYLPYSDYKRRILIKSKKPTSSDKSWYNLYSDGWVEQGGTITYTTGGGSAFQQTANLSIPLENNVYCINANVYRENKFISHPAEYYGVGVYRTTTSVTFRCAGANEGQFIDGVIWEAKGYTNLINNVISQEYDYYYVG